MDQKHRGAFSEGIAIAALLERGFDVFRNFSQHGLADIVAVNFETGEVYLIDVKTVGRDYRSRSLSLEQIASHVNLIEVTHDGNFTWTNRVDINAKPLKISKPVTGKLNEPEQHDDQRPSVSCKPILTLLKG